METEPEYRYEAERLDEREEHYYSNLSEILEQERLELERILNSNKNYYGDGPFYIKEF